MKHRTDNKVLLKEIKYTLDSQVDDLEFPIKSRLRQARYHAIDHGTPNHYYLDGFDYLKRGMVALTALLVVGIITFNLYMPEHFKPSLKDKAVLTESSEGAEDIQTAKSNSSPDTKKEIEIYNWLYDHYG